MAQPSVNDSKKLTHNRRPTQRRLEIKYNSITIVTFKLRKLLSKNTTKQVKKTKTAVPGSSRRSAGREFHTDGPTTEKARSANLVLVL